MLGTSASLRLRAMRALVLACGLGAAVPASAQIGSERYAAIVVDARSGNALIAANPDERRYPASLTKMMTVYLAFEALRDGRIQLSTPVPVSYSAASMAPSKLGLAPGDEPDGRGGDPRPRHQIGQRRRRRARRVARRRVRGPLRADDDAARPQRSA